MGESRNLIAMGKNDIGKVPLAVANRSAPAPPGGACVTTQGLGRRVTVTGGHHATVPWGEVSALLSLLRSCIVRSFVLIPPMGFVPELLDPEGLRSLIPQCGHPQCSCPN